jgi:hypothetical protein
MKVISVLGRHKTAPDLVPEHCKSEAAETIKLSRYMLGWRLAIVYSMQRDVGLPFKDLYYELVSLVL